MKRPGILFTILIVVSLPVTLINCLDPIPAGLETTIRGQLEDSVKQKKIGGAKVIVWGCGITFMRGEECFDIIDSVRTDKQGRFDIYFVTAGDAIRYEVSADVDESIGHPSREEVTAGRRNYFSLHARELNHLRIHEIEKDLASPVFARTGYGMIAQISKTTRDTVIYTRVLPMSENQVIFTTYDTAINASRISVDVANVDLRDTTLFTKKITDPTKWKIGM